MLEILAMVANTTGAVLAIVDQADWIAITVACASAAMSLADYFYIPSQVTATNRALEECHNLLQWWDSLSLVQRKARSCKLKCAQVTEEAVLNLLTSRTGASPFPLGGEDNEEEE